MQPTATATASGALTRTSRYMAHTTRSADPRHLRRHAAAMEAGTPYHTRLDPPPAHGWTPPKVR